MSTKPFEKGDLVTVGAKFFIKDELDIELKPIAPSACNPNAWIFEDALGQQLFRSDLIPIVTVLPAPREAYIVVIDDRRVVSWTFRDEREARDWCDKFNANGKIRRIEL